MTLKFYEIARLAAAPFLPPLHRFVRSKLSAMIGGHNNQIRILDVGGRKSPYTIGLDAKVTIIDLPRKSLLQNELNLGLNKQILDGMQVRRSNIENIVIGDITRSDLETDSFDLVVSVEVIEHVLEDDLFVSEISRILKPGGVFLVTTPNGDWLENKNPDHIRHYKKLELEALLGKHLDDVQIEYAIAGGRFRKYGLKSWSFKRPISTAASIAGNIINGFQSSGDSNKSKIVGTHHLIATAKKVDKDSRNRKNNVRASN